MPGPGGPAAGALQLVGPVPRPHDVDAPARRPSGDGPTDGGRPRTVRPARPGAYPALVRVRHVPDLSREALSRPQRGHGPPPRERLRGLAGAIPLARHRAPGRTFRAD